MVANFIIPGESPLKRVANFVNPGENAQEFFVNPGEGSLKK